MRLEAPSRTTRRVKAGGEIFRPPQGVDTTKFTPFSLNRAKSLTIQLESGATARAAFLGDVQDAARPSGRHPTLHVEEVKWNAATGDADRTGWTEFDSGIPRLFGRNHAMTFARIALSLCIASASVACDKADSGGDTADTGTQTATGVASGDQPDGGTTGGGTTGDGTTGGGTPTDNAGVFGISGPILTNEPKPTITWSRSTGASSYDLVVASDKSCVTAVFKALGLAGTQTSAQVDPALVDGSYYICMTASGATGKTAASNDGVSLTVDTTPPAAVSGFTASTAVGLGRITLHINGLPTSKADLATIDVRAMGYSQPSCTEGTSLALSPADLGTTTSVAFDAYGTPNAPMYFRLCVTDKAGNVESSKTASANAGTAHRLFVTSDRYTGDMKQDAYNINGGPYATGLAGADARCQHLAEAAGHPNRWVALVSDGSHNASSRVTISGPVYDNNWLMGEAEIAADATGLWSGTLESAPAFDESGNDVDVSTTVWTGTIAAGTSAVTKCSDWADGTAGVIGQYGVPTATNGWWLAKSTQTCSTQLALYCLEQAP